MTQVLKGDMLVISKGCYYQYFVPKSEKYADAQMLHWHSVFPVELKEFHYFFRWTEKFSKSNSTIPFISPSLLYIDFVYKCRNLFNNSLVADLSNLVQSIIKAELTEKETMQQAFSSQLKESQNFCSSLCTSQGIPKMMQRNENVVPAFDLVRDNQMFVY